MGLIALIATKTDVSTANLDHLLCKAEVHSSNVYHKTMINSRTSPDEPFSPSRTKHNSVPRDSVIQSSYLQVESENCQITVKKELY